MKPFAKIALINIGVILLYSLLIHLIVNGDQYNLGRLIASAYAVGFHVIGCLIVMMIMFADRQRELGRAWLGTSGIVLLVGFSVCLGSAAW